MNAARPEAAPRHRETQGPTGDSIATTIRNRDVRNELPYADLAKDLTDAHAHRPGVWQQDLDKVNKALHEKGLLPGLDIVGTRGQDLIAKDKDGKIKVVDSTDPTRSHEDTAKSTAAINGRKAEVNADGSGTVKVGKHDNPWNLSKDVLKSQGIDNPTPNQIANYTKELERLNGKDAMKKFHEGQDIKLPPGVSAKGADKTEFAGDRIEAKAKQEQADLQKQHDDFEAARAKYAGAGSSFGERTLPPSLSKKDIDYVLDPKNGLNPTGDERKALTAMRDKFDDLAKGSNWNTITPNRIFSGGIDTWQETAKADIEKRRVLAYADTRD